MAVVQLLLDGRTKVTADDIAETINSVQVAEEKVTATTKFIRVDRLNKWRRDHPLLASQHRVVLEIRECPLTRQQIQGARCLVQDDGVYDLDVSLASQVQHANTIDDGSLVLSGTQVPEKFEMAKELEAALRGGISGSVKAADILGDAAGSPLLLQSSSASAELKRKAAPTDDASAAGEAASLEKKLSLLWAS